MSSAHKCQLNKFSQISRPLQIYLKQTATQKQWNTQLNEDDLPNRQWE